MKRSLLIVALVAIGLTACSKKEEKVVTPPAEPAPTAPAPSTTPTPTPTPAPGADTTTPGSSSSSSSTSSPMGTTPSMPASPSESKPDEKK